MSDYNNELGWVHISAITQEVFWVYYWPKTNQFYLSRYCAEQDMMPALVNLGTL